MEREFKREPKIRGSQTSLYSRFYLLGTRRLRNGVKEKKEKEGLGELVYSHLFYISSVVNEQFNKGCPLFDDGEQEQTV